MRIGGMVSGAVSSLMFDDGQFGSSLGAGIRLTSIRVFDATGNWVPEASIVPQQAPVNFFESSPPLLPIPEANSWRLLLAGILAIRLAFGIPSRLRR